MYVTLIRTDTAHIEEMLSDASNSKTRGSHDYILIPCTLLIWGPTGNCPKKNGATMCCSPKNGRFMENLIFRMNDFQGYPHDVGNAQRLKVIGWTNTWIYDEHTVKKIVNMMNTTGIWKFCLNGGSPKPWVSVLKWPNDFGVSTTILGHLQL